MHDITGLFFSLPKHTCIINSRSQILGNITVVEGWDETYDNQVTSLSTEDDQVDFNSPRPPIILETLLEC